MGFNPRLNYNGMLNNFYWYSDNPFYQSNYGLPNCTCYAYGRFWEISDPQRKKENKPINLPLSDGRKMVWTSCSKRILPNWTKSKTWSSSLLFKKWGRSRACCYS